MTTLKDVAEHSGVSISIASRILNGDASVRARQETKDRVVRSAELLRYVPNAAGRNLRRSRTNLIALVVPDVTNATFADLAGAIESEAVERGYLMLLGSSQEAQPGAPGAAELPRATSQPGIGPRTLVRNRTIGAVKRTTAVECSLPSWRGETPTITNPSKAMMPVAARPASHTLSSRL